MKKKKRERAKLLYNNSIPETSREQRFYYPEWEAFLREEG